MHLRFLTWRCLILGTPFAIIHPHLFNVPGGSGILYTCVCLMLCVIVCFSERLSIATWRFWYQPGLFAGRDRVVRGHARIHAVAAHVGEEADGLPPAEVVRVFLRELRGSRGRGVGTSVNMMVGTCKESRVKHDQITCYL